MFEPGFPAPRNFQIGTPPLLAAQHVFSAAAERLPPSPTPPPTPPHPIISAAVDIALPEERIAIEVDGPFHFTRNSRRPMGDMYARAALLEARGWRVASVPYFAWASDREERRAYMEDLLARARAGARVHPTHDTPAAGQRARAAGDLPPAAAAAAPTPAPTPAIQPGGGGGSGGGSEAAGGRPPPHDARRMAQELAAALVAAQAAREGARGGWEEQDEGSVGDLGDLGRGRDDAT